MARTPELMGIGRAAVFLGINEDTLRHWIRCGEGPPRTRKGKRFYYVREVLKDWLKLNAPSVVASPHQVVPAHGLAGSISGASAFRR